MRLHHLIEYLDPTEVKAMVDKAFKNITAMDAEEDRAYLESGGKQFLDVAARISKRIDYTSYMRGWLKEIGEEYAQFDIGSLYYNIPTEEYSEFIAYAEELIAHGLFKLPYPKLIISMQYGGEHLLIVEQIEDKQHYDVSVFSYDKADKISTIARTDFLRLGGASMNVRFEKDGYAVDNTTITDMMTGGPVTALDDNDPFLSAVVSFICFFAALMGARGITTTKISQPDKLNKARLRRGKPPIYEIHEIKIVLGDQAYNPDGSHSTGNGTKKRMHWRRGHVRRLNTGKVTNVRPMLINPSVVGNPPPKPVYSVSKGPKVAASNA